MNRNHVTQSSYVFIYLTNETNSALPVYFDDLSVTHTSRVVQQLDYYPFGMEMAHSWQQLPNTIANRYRYNAGSEKNENTGDYETDFRHYNPLIGRFSSMDPHAAYYSSVSPYNYAFSNPILFNDPYGLDAIEVIGDDIIIHWDSVGGYGSTWTRVVGSHDFETLEETYSYLGQMGSMNGMASVNGGYSGEVYTGPAQNIKLTFENGELVKVESFYFKVLGPPGSALQGYVDTYTFERTTQNQPSGGGDVDFWKSNASVDLGMTGVGIANDVVNLSGEITSMHVAHGLQKITAAQAVGLAKMTKATAIIGGVVTVGVAGYEYKTGNFDSHSIVDITAGVILLGVGVTGAILVSPGILTGAAAVGLIYGVSSAVGSEWFDDYTNHAGRDWIYGK